VVVEGDGGGDVCGEVSGCVECLGMAEMERSYYRLGVVFRELAHVVRVSGISGVIIMLMASQPAQRCIASVACVPL